MVNDNVMQKVVECVPNFSEGRRPEVVERIVEAIKEAAGICVSTIHPMQP